MPCQEDADSRRKWQQWDWQVCQPHEQLWAPGDTLGFGTSIGGCFWNAFLGFPAWGNLKYFISFPFQLHLKFQKLPPIFPSQTQGIGNTVFGVTYPSTEGISILLRDTAYRVKSGFHQTELEFFCTGFRYVSNISNCSTNTPPGSLKSSKIHDQIIKKLLFKENKVRLLAWLIKLTNSKEVIRPNAIWLSEQSWFISLC